MKLNQWGAACYEAWREHHYKKGSINWDSSKHSYIHNGKIAVLLDASSLDDGIGRDICMHIAAMKPLAVSQDELDTKLSKEKEI